MDDLPTRIESELASIADGSVIAAIRERLVTPVCVMRDWDYAESQRYPCWIVAVDENSNTSIAYCEHGFGPASPWGLLNTETEFNEMGPDASWFSRLEDAFRDLMM